MEKTRIAVVGLGNWGRNHVRVFGSLVDCELCYLYDQDPAAVANQLRLYPGLHAAQSYDEILADPRVQAVVIATSSGSHFELGQRALEAGKDILIEKPMALSVEDAQTLCQIAESDGRLIQVGHLLLFHPAVQYLKNLIDSGELGEVYYLYSQRVNLGVVRSDENSLWSLAPHDFSLANYLLGGTPTVLSAAGGCYLRHDIEDVSFVTVAYPGGRIAHFHVSWLDPHKIRRLTIVGSRKMVVFDDMQITEKIRIYDKGVKRPEYETYGEALQIRMGDIHIPTLPNSEPLKLQAQDFLACVRERRRPLVSGEEGLAVVRILNEATRELNR